MLEKGFFSPHKMCFSLRNEDQKSGNANLDSNELVSLENLCI